MAGFRRQRADSFTLDLPNSGGDVVPSAALSPITELSMNFEHSSISMGRTPKRKLSMSNFGTPTPSASPCFLRTLSNESGYCPGSPIWPGCESPTIELLKSSGERRKAFQLRKPSFKRWNSSPAGADYDSNKENIENSLSMEFDSCADCNEAETKEDFVFARPRVPSFVRRFSGPSKNGKFLPQRSMSDPLSDQSPCFQSSTRNISPTELDSPESVCGVVFDDVEGGDDGFIDDLVCAQEGQDDSSVMPSGMAGLLSAPLVSSSSGSPVSSGESHLGEKHGETPKQIAGNSEARPRDLFNTAAEKATAFGGGRCSMRPRSKSFALKRPNPPRDPSPLEKKRLRQRCMSLVEGTGICPPMLENRVVARPSPLKRSNSEVFENRPGWQFGNLLGTGTNRNLVGDFSKPYILPSIPGQHEDLKSITPETVARLINGEFNTEVDEFYIIDCRYPFEYKGGHIQGAVNIYTKEDMIKEFIEVPKGKEGKRVILVFHCEFSSKRGPDIYMWTPNVFVHPKSFGLRQAKRAQMTFKLNNSYNGVPNNRSRFLRNKDRDIHRQAYPALFYPEMYVIDGGYKNFYCTYKEYCEPQDYVLMLDENHSNDLKLFSKRSKSWSEGNGKKLFRPGLNYR